MQLLVAITLVLICVLPECIRSELCGPARVPYILGQNVTLLDITSEDVSVLTAPCTKNITLTDALIIYLYVEEAKFGSNSGFTYSDMGVTPTQFNDSAFLTNRCSSGLNTDTRWRVPIETGTHIYNKTDCLCIGFVPEMKYRNLGYHTKGGRIKISIRVEFGYCNENSTAFDLTGPRNNRKRRGNCRLICSANTTVSTCDGVDSSTPDSLEQTTRPSSNKDAPSPMMSLTTDRSPNYQTASIHPYTLATRRHSTTARNSETSSPHKGFLRNQSTLYGYLASATTYTTNRRTTVLMVTTGLNEPAIHNPFLQVTSIAKNIRKSTTTTLTTKHADVTASAAGLVTTHTSTSTSLQMPDLYHQSSKPIHTETVKSNKTLVVTVSMETVGTTQENTMPTYTGQANSSFSSSKTFGLLEGLCVLVGCLVMFVIAATFVYCLRIRKRAVTRVVSPLNDQLENQRCRMSDISYISQWRNNWFVRYHEKEHEDEMQADSDNDNDNIHGDFVHKSNQELHSIYTDSLIASSCPRPSPYDNPWPLITLDSEFVRKTKKIEKSVSNEDGTSKTDMRDDVNPKLEQKVSMVSSDSGTEGREVNECDGPFKNEPSSLKDKTGEVKERFRYIKRVNSHLRSRGSYNLVKAERSASLSNYDVAGSVEVGRSEQTHRGYTKDGMCKKEHQYHEISDIVPLTGVKDGPRRHYRQRNSSSMCSDSSITFEEMIKEEISKVENENFATNAIKNEKLTGNKGEREHLAGDKAENKGGGGNESLAGDEFITHVTVDQSGNDNLAGHNVGKDNSTSETADNKDSIIDKFVNENFKAEKKNLPDNKTLPNGKGGTKKQEHMHAEYGETVADDTKRRLYALVTRKDGLAEEHAEGRRGAVGTMQFPK